VVGAQRQRYRRMSKIEYDGRVGLARRGGVSRKALGGVFIGK